ncbi:integrase, catalytic region, zinc finger, CCHC-type containing protein [Tanacetum coccineum]
MSTANQQTLAESGAEGRPLILEKGSYVPWASQFLRLLDNKREEGVLMRNSIDKGPYKRKEIVDPNDDTKKILEPIKDISVEDIDQYYADIKERHSRLMNEFDKFVAKDGESLTSMYERFSTLINNMDQNKVKPKEISINTKLLNSLQPDWSKYVTLTHQKYILETEHYDKLYDYLIQFEPHVKPLKAKKAARNHDPLALVANSYANPSYSHPKEDAQEDILSTAMMLLARAITHHYSTPTNNRLRTLSNTRNQAVIQDGLVDIKSKNVGYAENENVQRIPRTASTPGKTNVQCYNCNGKGHYARDYPKPRVRDAKYFREQMLLATKDEAGVNLDTEENDFMLMNAYGDDQLEELNASVIMMAHIQPTNDKSDAGPTYDAEVISEDNSGKAKHDPNAHDQHYET